VIKTCCGFSSLISFPKKLSRLPVALSILSTLDSKYSWRNFGGDEGIRENSKTFSP